jgi:hypothetical protein
MFDYQKLKMNCSHGNFKNFKIVNKKPFGKLEIDFLQYLSKNIFSEKNSKKYPEIISYAFWIRRENLNRLREKHQTNKNKLGLGNILHITPSNVPINFAYSFTIGLLTGNSNMVRLPSQKFNEVVFFLKLLKKSFKNKKFREISLSNIFFQYNSSDDAITQYLCKISDGRIIWGGDETSKKFKNFETKPRTKDIFLTDRYSFSLVVSKKFNKLKNEKLSNFIRNFYNDAFFMDQNACTSPHLIIWLGNKKENQKSQLLFWNELKKIAKEKYSLDLFYSAKKYFDICDDILMHDNIIKYYNYDSLIYRVKLKNLKKGLSQFRRSFGYFYEFDCTGLSDLKNFIDEKFQTLTYYGLDKNLILEFIYKNGIKGIDRIMPIGLAHEMSFFWDGYDLEEHMTRTIDAK